GRQVAVENPSDDDSVPVPAPATRKSSRRIPIRRPGSSGAQPVAGPPPTSVVRNPGSSRRQAAPSGSKRTSARSAQQGLDPILLIVGGVILFLVIAAIGMWFYQSGKRTEINIDIAKLKEMRDANLKAGVAAFEKAEE